MAKTVADKLLIKPDSTVWFSDAGGVALIGGLPDGATTVTTLAQASVAVLFAGDADSTRALLAKHAANLTRPSALWVAYPKGNRTDINRDTLWPLLSGYRMRPISQIAIDDTWSALRFRPLADGEPDFAGTGQRDSSTGGK